MVISTINSEIPLKNLTSMEVTSSQLHAPRGNWQKYRAYY